MWHAWVYKKNFNSTESSWANMNKGNDVVVRFGERIYLQLQGSPVSCYMCLVSMEMDGKSWGLSTSSTWSKSLMLWACTAECCYQPNTAASSREPQVEKLRSCYRVEFRWKCLLVSTWLGLCVGAQHCIVLWIWLTVKRRSKRRGKWGLPESSRAAGSILRSQLPRAGCGSQANARLPRPSWSNSSQQRRRRAKKAKNNVWTYIKKTSGDRQCWVIWKSKHLSRENFIGYPDWIFKKKNNKECV